MLETDFQSGMMGQLSWKSFETKFKIHYKLKTSAPHLILPGIIDERCMCVFEKCWLLYFIGSKEVESWDMMEMSFSQISLLPGLLESPKLLSEDRRQQAFSVREYISVT